MYKYYYNPETRNGGLKQYINVTKVDDPCYESEKTWFNFAIKAGDMFQDPFEEVAPAVIHTVEDLCAVMKQAGYSGSERFIAENGDLYSINQNGSFEYGPLEYDGQNADFGINWAMKYFFTEEAALAFGNSLNADRKPYDDYRQWDKPMYSEELDTWSVRYHR